MEKLVLGDLSIDVIRKQIKNLHLGVYPPHGRVRIAAPVHTKDEAIRLFAISKISWIKRHVRNFGNQERQSPRRFVSGESHYVEGRRYRLEVVVHDAPPCIELKHTKLIVAVRKGSSGTKIAEVLNEWHRERLKNQIPPLIAKWEKKLGVQVDDFGVKMMKTKWGSCSIGKKKIWLNLELAKKPAVCLEYLVVHEMIHLLEKNHNEKFYKLISTALPNWKQYREELNRLPVSHSEWGY